MFLFFIFVAQMIYLQSFKNKLRDTLHFFCFQSKQSNKKEMQYSKKELKEKVELKGRQGKYMGKKKMRAVCV